jgi:uncharacterized protein
MHLWIDADACPNIIKQIIIKTATRLSIPTTFVANQPVEIPTRDGFDFVLVEDGPDVADQYIIDNSAVGDLVVTQDIPLAAELVAKKVMVINTHGSVLDASNVGSRLATRDVLQGLRDAGEHTGGPKPFSVKDKERFANSLDKWLHRLLKDAELRRLRGQ